MSYWSPQSVFLGRVAPGVSLRALALACWLLTDGGTAGLVFAEDLSWDVLDEGISMALWEPRGLCDDVPPLVLIRIDSDRFRFATQYYRAESLPGPLTINEWQKRTGAVFLFNSGQFRENYSYLGLLFQNGRSVGSKRHPNWQGLFVAEPVAPGLRNARVVDLSSESFPEQPPAYRQVAQSLMLLDAQGKPRVRRSGKQAYQTVVGEDRDGHILVIKSTDVVPLWELAMCLHEGVPTLHQAMAMDGGSSSDIIVSSELLARRRNRAALPAWISQLDGSSTRHIPLPAVIAIYPRQPVASRPSPPPVGR
jgi:uncharacterized protein YigE (DUF2233 family)